MKAKKPVPSIFYSPPYICIQFYPYQFEWYCEPIGDSFGTIYRCFKFYQFRKIGSHGKSLALLAVAAV